MNSATADAARPDPIETRPHGAVTDDLVFGGRLRLRQPARGHRVGTDAMLLAHWCEPKPGDRIVDLGSSTGAVGLLLALRHEGVGVRLVERDAMLADHARRNVAENGLAGRVEVSEADVFDTSTWARAGLVGGAADLIVTNPPFFDRTERASPESGRRSAHVMDGGDLAGWIAAAARLLIPNGRLAMIQRSDALERCLDALRPGFGSLVVVAVQAKPDADANRILISARRNGRAPMRIRPPIVLQGADGSQTAEAARVHGVG